MINVNKLIPTRDTLLELCEEEFNVNREDLIQEYTRKGGKTGRTHLHIYLVYLSIIWFVENSKANRSKIALLFKRHHSTTNRAIECCRGYIDNRDFKFYDIFQKFNLMLSNNGFKEIELTKRKLSHIPSRITKEEKYHIKFMLKYNIPIEDISKHFNTTLITIQNIKDDIK